MDSKGVRARVFHVSEPIGIVPMEKDFFRWQIAGVDLIFRINNWTSGEEEDKVLVGFSYIILMLIVHLFPVICFTNSKYKRILSVNSKIGVAVFIYPRRCSRRTCY